MNDDLFYEDKSYYLDPSKSYQKKDSSNLKISRDSVLNDYPYMRINRGDIVQENQNQDNDIYSRSSRRINYTGDNFRNLIIARCLNVCACFYRRISVINP